jgi:signal transduction histidine kinase
MKHTNRFALILVVLFAFAACFALTASADEKADAIKMVKDAGAFYQANGMEKTLDAINDKKGPFIKGTLYLTCFDTTGILLANSQRPDLVGQNLLEVPDSKGKKFRKEFIETAMKNGSGWVDYTYLNPKSKVEEQKTTYIERFGDLILGCGVYK